jgi:ribosomal protein L19
MPSATHPLHTLTLGSDAARTIAAVRQVANYVSAEAERELTQAIVDYAGTLKGQGFRAEQIIILVNRVMIENGVDRSLDHHSPLIDRIVKTCVVEYYRAGSGPE